MSVTTKSGRKVVKPNKDIEKQTPGIFYFFYFIFYINIILLYIIFLIKIK